MKYFIKEANLKPEVTLRPHQQNAVDRISKKDGSLLLSHATGSGKTVTAIAAFDRLKQEGKAKKALIVAPASLRDNFAESGIRKFTDDKYVIFGSKQENAGSDSRFVDPDKFKDESVPYHIVSYDMYKKDPAKYIKAAKADTVIYDEIHRAKNETTNVTKVIKEARPLHRNFIGLTGSIVSNTPADIVPLIDAMTGGKHKLGSKALFESRFLEIDKDGKKNIKDKRLVRAQTAPYIDHVEKEDLQLSPPPKKVVETIKVPMSKHQEDLYRYLIDELDPVTKAKIKYGFGKKLNQREVASIFSKLMATRQLSNYVKAINPEITHEQSLEESPKMQRVLEEVEKHLKSVPDARIVVGSQFITSGIKPMEYHLRQRGYDPAVFIGKGNKGITESYRQREIEDFKAGKKKILLISGAGGEGLDLPDTTKIIMLDGHYNPEVIEQMEARGIRAGGLPHRPEKERKVEVTRFITKPSIRKVDVAAGVVEAISPSTYFRRGLAGEPLFVNPIKRPFGVDELIADVAKRKYETNAELKALYKKSEVKPKKAFKGYLVNPKKISREYMKEFGDRLENDTDLDIDGWIDREKEKKYIDQFKNEIHVSTQAAGIGGLIAQPLASSSYSEKDFDNTTGKIKTKSVLNKAFKVGLTSVPIGLFFDLKRDMRGPMRQKYPTPLLTAALPLTFGSMKYFSDKQGTIYTTKPLAALKRMSKLKDEDIRDILRGAVVKKEETKVKQHYL